MFRKCKNSSLLFVRAQDLTHAANEDQSNGMKKRALKKFKKAMSLFIVIENKSGEATCLNNIGLILESKGNLYKALEIYRKVLSIDISQMKVLEEAITTSNIGRIFEKLLNYQEALLHFNRALVILSRISLSTELQYLKEVATLHIKNLRLLIKA